MDLIINFYIIQIMKIQKKLMFQTETIINNIPDIDCIINPVNDKTSFCRECNKSMGRKTVIKHYNEIHLCKKVSCPICGIKIKRLTPHLNIHTKNDNKRKIFLHVSPLENSSNFNYIEHKSNILPSLNNIENIYNKIIKLYQKDIIKDYNNIYSFKSFIIGEGHHSKFVFGLIKDTNHPIGIKIYKNKDSEHIKKEIDIMYRLEKYKIFPKVQYFNENKNSSIIPQTLLGIDLSRLFNFEKGNFDSITILNIAKDILYCLSFIHNEGIYHCDIKSDNLVWNIFCEKNEKTKIILIDFSCAVGSNNKSLYKKIGSNYYSSLNQTLKNIPNENDEIESMMYTLLDLLNIELPWGIHKKIKKEEKKKFYIFEKTNFKIEDFLNEDLKVLGLIFNDVKRKNKIDSEDYKFYEELLDNQIEKLKKKYDLNFRFIWQPHIKKLILDTKTQNRNLNMENKLLNELFYGFPKEFVLDLLSNNFIDI